ncbi:MAG: hypothetical protein AAF591_11125, partial [Verrucomicrobiota bacterium]
DQIGLFFDGANAPAPLENSALNQAVWKGDKKLVGDWKKLSEKNGIDTFVLVDPAIVFGVIADQVRANRENGDLTGITIGFRPGDKVTADSQDELVALLQKNIETFTGVTAVIPKANAKSRLFDYDQLVITVAPGFADAVEVSIAPAATKAVAQKD